MTAQRAPHWTYPELKVRKQVLRRDNYECQIRGPNCTLYANTVDHIHPKAWGGLATPSNLRAACWTCNQQKGARAQSSSFFIGSKHSRAPLANPSPLRPKLTVASDYSRKPREE